MIALLGIPEIFSYIKGREWREEGWGEERRERGRWDERYLGGNLRAKMLRNKREDGGGDGLFFDELFRYCLVLEVTSAFN